jgi:hypothetical protein
VEEEEDSRLIFSNFDSRFSFILSVRFRFCTVHLSAALCNQASRRAFSSIFLPRIAATACRETACTFSTEKSRHPSHCICDKNRTGQQKRADKRG